MAYNAKILKDSQPLYGTRLTTMEVTFPRIVLAEFNTHRTFSRNSASSRAIPVEKQIKKIEEDPFIPIHWGKNQKGMQAEKEVDDDVKDLANKEWLEARDNAVANVRYLLGVGIHKQITNRLLEPFMWQTVIVTATEWENFFGLRCNKDAQPEIRKIADMMQDLYQSSIPQEVGDSDWHMPLVDEAELRMPSTDPMFWQRVSVGRCARVSYLTHDGRRDPLADIELAARLQESGHMSPFEHVATPLQNSNAYCGNFKGWMQYRKQIVNEDNFSKTLVLV